jgi:protein-S-isoprenylcysteine O-methyltransferase Ste14
MSHRFRVPPWVLVPAVVLIYGTVNVGIPLALSSLAPRHGWDGNRPGLLNLVGVLPVLAGALIVFLAGARHMQACRDREWRVLKFDPEHLLTPDYLVTGGLYRYTRNPLYVGDMTMWLGWAVLLGSVPVAIGLAALFAGLQLGVRLEERGLARQFGDQWQTFAAPTPRFLGRRRAPKR